MQKNLKIIIAIALIASSVFLFSQGENKMGALLMILLIIVPNADKLTDLVINKDGIQAKFETPKEKIEENIKENHEKITKQNLVLFQNIESSILEKQQKKYDNEMKTLVHYMYGKPDKPQFIYTPDGSLQTEDALYFFEIKYVLKPEFAKAIIKETTDYLSKIYNSFSPMSGKKLVMKLILASQHDLDLTNINIPDGIEIEFTRI